MIRVKLSTPVIRLSECAYNAGIIIEEIRRSIHDGADIIVFPELVITGYTCGDLLKTTALQQMAEDALEKIMDYSRDTDIAIIISLPVTYNGRNTVRYVILQKGKITGELIVVNEEEISFSIKGSKITLHPGNLMLKDRLNKGFIINPCAIPYTAGLIPKMEHCLKCFSKDSVILSVSAGPGESTDDILYSGIKMYAHNGSVKETVTVKTTACFDVDCYDSACFDPKGFGTKDFDPKWLAPGGDGTNEKEDYCIDKCNKLPFLPKDNNLSKTYCLDILKIQAESLAKRINDIGCKTVILGLSGGLDSTVALIACVNAFDRLGKNREDIICVSMPGFGTGNRTYNNSLELAKLFNTGFKLIDIKEYAGEHLKALGQPEDTHGFITDITYENAQARMRTMFLMNLSNMYNGIVIGTGDMSELALGWCTYNGDHMSMYSVNSGIPKTVMPKLIDVYLEYIWPHQNLSELKKVLKDIVDTPVSPELIKGQITQDTIGPYVLHDYFLYNFLEKGELPETVVENAYEVFKKEYTKETIKKWAALFFKHFFIQQFKRSCLPVGPKVFEYSLSPRQGFLMPSDISYTQWIDKLK